MCLCLRLSGVLAEAASISRNDCLRIVLYILKLSLRKAVSILLWKLTTSGLVAGLRILSSAPLLYLNLSSNLLRLGDSWRVRVRIVLRSSA